MLLWAQPLVAAGYHAVVYDALGHGESDPTPALPCTTRAWTCAPCCTGLRGDPRLHIFDGADHYSVPAQAEYVSIVSRFVDRAVEAR